MPQFDTEKELAQLKSQTQAIRKRGYHKSRLDKYKGELIKLNAKGASTAELQRWLRGQHLRVEWSTVHRWLVKHA
jgi:hypothetical protein